MADQRAISMKTSAGIEWMKSTSCWKVSPMSPHAIWALVNRWAITNRPTGKTPESECRRRSTK